MELTSPLGTPRVHLPKNVLAKWLTLIFFMLGVLPVGAASLDSQRTQFKDARKALHAHQLDRFRHISKSLKTYPLYIYLRYEYLSARLGSASEKEITTFLSQFSGTPPADLLRRRWLKKLADKADWQRYQAHYLPQQSISLQCRHLYARLHNKDSDGVYEQARDLWRVGKSQPKECDPLFDKLYKSALMTPALRWQRIELAMLAGESSLAKYLGRQLPVEDNRLLQVWLEMSRHPVKMLRHKLLKLDEPRQRVIISDGLVKLARHDVGKAAAKWQRLVNKYQFSDEQQGRVQKQLAYAAIRQDDSEIMKYLDDINSSQLDHRLHKNRLREALLRDDWPAVLRWTAPGITNPPNELRWRYWHARAQDETGKTRLAISGYRELAVERDYYGFLAAEHLGMGYQFNENNIQATATERNTLLMLPAVQRARELHHHKMLVHARREWYQLMKVLDPRQQEVAALVASEWGWHDRAILTLGGLRNYDALELRFPMPFNKLVNTYARKRNLLPSVMFSIMRSESAFMEDARSPVGALGLMQLMPQTGKQTAKRINMKLKRSHDLLTARINIPIGSAYLRQMLDRFKGSLPMAAGAYNAGPHRVKTWQPEKTCMTAEKWIETVPFTETRRYIRRALFNATIYDWKLGNGMLSMMRWMQPVLPKQKTKKTATTCQKGVALIYG